VKLENNIKLKTYFSVIINYYHGLELQAKLQILRNVATKLCNRGYIKFRKKKIDSLILDSSYSLFKFDFGESLLNIH
jgi:hypothetical protein